MTIDERTRHQLFLRLEAVLGPADAETLMEHLPPVGWADVATKRDLDAHAVATKRDLDAHAVATKRDLDALGESTKRDLDVLAASTQQGFDALRVEVGAFGDRLEARFERSLRQVLTTVAGFMVAGFGATVAAVIAR